MLLKDDDLFSEFPFLSLMTLVPADVIPWKKCLLEQRGEETLSAANPTCDLVRQFS